MDKKDTPSPKVTPSVKKVNASEKLQSFLISENIELSLTPMVNSIVTVSDGSIIIGKQQITASYKNERQN